MNQQDKRSELQERIAADLREKAKKSSLQDKAMVDGAEDSKYLEGTKKTSALAGAWLLIVAMVIALVIMLFMQGN